MHQQTTRQRIVDHCSRYPALQPGDLLKWIHQSTFGCVHLIASPESAADFLRRELEGCTASDRDIEALDGGFCRVHLRHLQGLGISPDTFARLFALSAAMPCGTDAQLEARLTVALALAEEGALPFSSAALTHAADTWRRDGYPVCHHSETFRRSYAPAYRVLHRSHAQLLPLLAVIDQKMAAQDRVLLAIEGGAGSGKSTLASLLQQLYGCQVLHMDDFFLRPEQRTPERYATPGGNVDHERFAAEVLPGLRQGLPFRYRPFDCGTFTVADGYEVTPTPLTVVEGSYSLHPALGDYYDCAVFLQVTPEVQRRRILRRNTPEFAQRFFDTWIPLEQAYFAAMDPAGRCDLILEVEL